MAGQLIIPGSTNAHGVWGVTSSALVGTDRGKVLSWNGSDISWGEVPIYAQPGAGVRVYARANGSTAIGLDDRCGDTEFLLRSGAAEANPPSPGTWACWSFEDSTHISVTYPTQPSGTNPPEGGRIQLELHANAGNDDHGALLPSCESHALARRDAGSDATNNWDCWSEGAQQAFVDGRVESWAHRTTPYTVPADKLVHPLGPGAGIQADVSYATAVSPEWAAGLASPVSIATSEVYKLELPLHIEHGEVLTVRVAVSIPPGLVASGPPSRGRRLTIDFKNPSAGLAIQSRTALVVPVDTTATSRTIQGVAHAELLASTDIAGVLTPASVEVLVTADTGGETVTVPAATVMQPTVLRAGIFGLGGSPGYWIRREPKVGADDFVGVTYALPPMQWQGAHVQANSYHYGDVVSHAGSLWVLDDKKYISGGIANTIPGGPGETNAVWHQLVVDHQDNSLITRDEIDTTRLAPMERHYIGAVEVRETGPAGTNRIIGQERSTDDYPTATPLCKGTAASTYTPASGVHLYSIELDARVGPTDGSQRAPTLANATHGARIGYYLADVPAAGAHQDFVFTQGGATFTLRLAVDTSGHWTCSTPLHSGSFSEDIYVQMWALIRRGPPAP